MKQSKSYAIKKIPSVSGGTPNGTRLTNKGITFRKEIISELGIGKDDFISVYKGFPNRKEIKVGDYSVKDILSLHSKIYNIKVNDSKIKKFVLKKSERNVLPFQSSKGATKVKKKEMKIEVSLKEDNSIVQPSHYERYKIEPINFIMLNDLSFWVGNIVKYVVRAGYKEGVDEKTDLLKARRYIDMRLNQLEGKNPNELRD